MQTSPGPDDPRLSDQDEQAAQREREEQVRRDARRARRQDPAETHEFVRELGFGELLDD